MNVALMLIAAVMALPVLLLVGVAIGPIALVALLIVACAAPPFVVAGLILRRTGKS